MDHRIFLVGCSRSGTTLLQSIIASHPRLTSFPETDFFRRIDLHPRRRHLVRLGLAMGTERKRLKKILRDNALEHRIGDLGRQPLTFRGSVNAYIHWLDEIARARGKTGWVEKTPLHLLSIPRISRYVPDARFVHVLRKGTDVVASIRDRALKRGGDFASQQHVDYGIALWNRCMAEHEKYVGHPDHAFFCYEDVAKAPEHALASIGHHLGLVYEATYLERRSEVAADIVRASETHKRGVSGGIHAPISKVDTLFDDETKAYIENHLETERYERLAAYST